MTIQFHIFLFFNFIYSTITAPQANQHQDTSQLEITETVTAPPNVSNDTVKIVDNSVIFAQVEPAEDKRANTQVSFSIRAYNLVAEPLSKIMQVPKVNMVIRNIGTCIVNGAMELFSYYLPPTFMPLVASAAGFMIPFEPVVMLKERMPVNTYRRAFKTALKTFLNSFDQFKYEDEIDPYMTRRFNNRFVDDNKKTSRRDIED